jgi:hypothetical protein
MNSGSTGDGKLGDSAPFDFLPQCPFCDGAMETVYARPHQRVCQCVDCACSLTVPVTAWAVASRKRMPPPAA